MKIFVSYCHKDENIVLPVVNGLIEKYGKSTILIDNEVLKPGDSIIDFMNDSLGQFTHFILFLSSNSIESPMVSIEWKTALPMCDGRNTKFIPVIIDSVKVPRVLNNIYQIRMFEFGLNYCMQQLFSTFDIQKDDKEFHQSSKSNLSASIKNISEHEVEVTIATNYYSEPNSSFCIVLNTLTGVNLDFSEMFQGSNELKIFDGQKRMLQFVRLFRPLSVGTPFKISFLSNDKISIYKVLHVLDVDGKLKGVPIE